MYKLNQHKQYYTVLVTNAGVRVFINVLSFENILWVHKNVSISGAFWHLLWGSKSQKSIIPPKKIFIANIVTGHDFYV